LEVCPARLAARQPWDTSTIELWACARFDAGTVQASVVSTENVANVWLAPGPKVGARWNGRHFFFELGGSLAFPIDRRLALDPRSSGFYGPYGTEYHVPGMLGAFGLGVGWLVL
jgi:hypothetical protein